jgi:hypothetical protein
MSRRLALGVAAGALAILLAVYPALDARVPTAALLSLGVPALVLYMAAVLRLWPGGLPAALALLALEYLAAVYLRGGRIDLLAPVYAAGLFICAELSWLALESSGGHAPWPSRLLAIAALTIGGFLAGLGLLAVGLVPFPSGPALTAAGVVAAVAASAGLSWLARSSAAGERQF